jgi:hypothetical protein
MINAQNQKSNKEGRTCREAHAVRREDQKRETVQAVHGRQKQAVLRP